MTLETAMLFDTMLVNESFIPCECSEKEHVGSILAMLILSCDGSLVIMGSRLGSGTSAAIYCYSGTLRERKSQWMLHKVYSKALQTFFGSPRCEKMKWYTSVPVMLFRAKSSNFLNLREFEAPLWRNTTLALPTNDQRWLGHPPLAAGMSLLVNGPKLFDMRPNSYRFFDRGFPIPPDLILYQTSRQHFALQPAVPMDLKGTFKSLYRLIK